MKKILLFLLVMTGCLSAAAQDVIVKKDGSTVLCKIVAVSDTEVVYSKWQDAKGSRYIIDRSLVSNINYEDGRKETLSEQTSNAYAPGNQQTGETNFNDNALLLMDIQRNEALSNNRKAKTSKLIGLAVGVPVTALGLICGVAAIFGEDFPLAITGGGVALIGITVTTVCLIKSYQYKKKNQMMSFNSIFKKEYNFKNGSSLCAGIDLIRDKREKLPSFGLGLQYNF